MARTSTLQAGGITEAKVLDPYDPLAASRTSISVSGDVDIYMKTHSTAHARCGSYSIWFQYFLHIQYKQAFLGRYSETVTNSSWQNLEFFKKNP